MKLVVDSETDKVLGASMCGPDAAEIMQVTSRGTHGTGSSTTIALLIFFLLIPVKYC